MLTLASVECWPLGGDVELIRVFESFLVLCEIFIYAHIKGMLQGIQVIYFYLSFSS